ncbi:iron-sulfur cluster biosynthesis family protein [Lentilactobacillus buchneri]|uniref:iron-sulfur cluster biosynthesis family protein n=1 Tax=Lentilactobacillus buchneri TaxID=1581 RepID=UPI0010ACDBCD|nr:iron-sulfur cluster biosynthesis family protein [Lentilactobacillus buchneri]TJY00756.1 iron-sulfur cluster biosynthesis family protein [Lentilactobacillus buchneri]TJY05964.1 iron-sulfur cluster biosynthesis family protein [Lentilactobacillus buchneri]TJY10074.1 iron-sulfur cluster biosynthesis family protein [Lentilactobacillus buchneri]TJY16826.1 iron-sulfur cluster biosynthesis family protein [Lentilactobacillus buchneri]TJY20695.1 iron-sulfur cluster biosynthesis family protein [Lentil
MKLTITDAALAQLKKVFPANSKLLLSFDDGVGPFSKVGVCSLDTSYDVIAVDKDAKVPDYDTKLSANSGDWYFKGYSKIYLDEDMKLDYKNNQVVLSGESGIMDSNIELKYLTKQSVE